MHKYIGWPKSKFTASVFCSPFQVIAPYFFEKTVTGENCAEMLEEVVLLELQNSKIYDFLNLIWQQYGAPPHYTLKLHEILDKTFNEWIGRQGKIDWPPRSCNLTPCDFAIWGIIREKIFQTKPDNIEHLKELITDAFEELHKDKRTIRAIYNATVSRYTANVETNG